MIKPLQKFAVGLCALMLSTSALPITSFAQDVLDSPLWAIDATDGTWFANDNNTRGFAFIKSNDRLYVVSRTGGLGIFVIDALTGTHLKNLDVTGIAGGIFPASLIDVSPEGHIFAQI